MIFRGKKGAGEIDVERLAPYGGGQTWRRPHLAKRAGIVEGNVETAEARDCQFHQCSGIGLVLDIACQADGRSAARSNFPDQFLKLRLAPRPDNDFRSGIGEKLCGSAAYAGTGAGDDRNFVDECVHGEPHECLSNPYGSCLRPRPPVSCAIDAV